MGCRVCVVYNIAPHSTFPLCSIMTSLTYLAVGLKDGTLSALFGDSLGGELVFGRRLARRRVPVFGSPGHGGGDRVVTLHVHRIRICSCDPVCPVSVVSLVVGRIHCKDFKYYIKFKNEFFSDSTFGCNRSRKITDFSFYKMS